MQKYNMFPMVISDKVIELIQEFVDTDSINAVNEFTSSNENNDSDADKIAAMFGYSGSFASASEEEKSKQVTSFKNNLKLLIQKTWVEKDDVTLKEVILLRLDELECENGKWNVVYKNLLEIIENAVYLMFGQTTKSDDFGEYSLRIDPEFGIFWWFIKSLPENAEWSDEKYRSAVLLGMYFLANY